MQVQYVFLTPVYEFLSVVSIDFWHIILLVLSLKISYYLNRKPASVPLSPKTPSKKPNQQPFKSKQIQSNIKPLEQSGSWITCAEEHKRILDDDFLTLRLQTCQNLFFPQYYKEIVHYTAIVAIIVFCIMWCSLTIKWNASNISISRISPISSEFNYSCDTMKHCKC